MNNLVVALKDYQDIRSLRNGQFHHTKKGETEVITLDSPELLGDILAKQFHISLTHEEIKELFTGFCTK